MLNSRQSSYSPNLLNQYGSRNVPAAVDAYGQATADATVSVNDIRADRKANYFSASLDVDNSSAAAAVTAKVGYVAKRFDYRNDRWIKVDDRVYLKTERR